jgi:ABC-type lipoprotein export system ATPase subunit
MNAAPLVRLTGIGKAYGAGAAQVLRGIDAEIGGGEMVALMGGSGSGKTTLVNILGLLDAADSGSYVLDGQEATTLGPRRGALVRRRKIGFLFQSFELIGGLSAIENVALPLRYRGVRRAEAEAEATLLLDGVGLGGHGRKRPTQLSGGQQQRVALARAVASRPVLLLADEPTGNLDPETAAGVVALLRRHCAASGAAAILVTHDRAVAAACDRTLMLHQGRLAAAVAS